MQNDRVLYRGGMGGMQLIKRFGNGGSGDHIWVALVHWKDGRCTYVRSEIVYKDPYVFNVFALLPKKIRPKGKAWGERVQKVVSELERASEEFVENYDYINSIITDKEVGK